MAERNLRNIAAYYRSLAPGRLVVTGTPGLGSDDAGTGKTVLAVALILGLARDRGPDEPVPVRLSASSWSGDTVPDWLVTHLTEVFHLPRREARALVAAHLVLPVIDGLDEMDAEPRPGYASRAAKLLRAVEGYEREGEKAPVVLTCRRPHYEALVDADVQPQVVAQIEIARVDAERIRGYLTGRIGYSEQNLARWQPVLDAVTAPSASSALVGALNTPWRLTLTAVVYEERDPHTGAFLRKPKDLVRLAESGELYGHLLDRYVKAAVNAPSGDGKRSRRPDPSAVWRHLAVLAAYLHANTTTPHNAIAGRELSGTDIVLHELWPLAGPRRPRIVSALLLSCTVFGILALYLVFGGTDIVVVTFVGAVAALTVLAGVAAYGGAWPQPVRLSLRPLATLPGLSRTVMAALVGGIVGGLLGGFLYSGPWRTMSGWIPYVSWGFFHWPSVLGAFGFGCLLSLTFSSRDDPVGDPRGGLRGDLTAWLVSGLVLGVLESVETPSLLGTERFTTLGRPVLAAGVVAYGLMMVVVWGLVVSVKDAVPAARGIRAALGGPAVLRYVSLLLCTRGRLPWRLGGLLHRCYELGLLRVAGAAYQFRHREFQEHLATRPHPPGF